MQPDFYLKNEAPYISPNDHSALISRGFKGKGPSNPLQYPFQYPLISLSAGGSRTEPLWIKQANCILLMYFWPKKHTAYFCDPNHCLGSPKKLVRVQYYVLLL